MSCFMVFPQSLDCLLDLRYLVRFRHLAVSLKVNARVSLPWSLENVVAACNTRLSEKLPAEIQQVVKRNVPCAIENPCGFSHIA